MYCTNCGHENTDDARFCEACGYDLAKDDASSAQETAKNEAAPQLAQETASPGVLYGPGVSYPRPAMPRVRVRLGLRARLTILIVAIVVVAGAVFAVWAQNQTKPETVALAFFKEAMGGDYTAAYHSVDLPSSPFNSEKLFQANAREALVGSGSNKKLVNCEVVATQDNSSALTRKITIRYLLDGQSAVSTVSLTLTRQNTPKWLVFENWKVSPAQFVTQDYKIYAPAGAAVYLDGVHLDTKYLQNASSSGSSGSRASSGSSASSSAGIAYTPSATGGTPLAAYGSSAAGSASSQDVYVVPSILNGTHDLKVTTPYTNEVDSKVEIRSGDPSYQVTGLALSDQAKTALAQQAKTVLTTYYGGVIAGSDFSGIGSLLTQQAQDDGYVKGKYDNDVEEYGPKSQNRMLKKLEVTDLKVDSANLSQTTLGVELETTCKLSYTVSYIPYSYSFFGSTTPSTPVDTDETDTWEPVFQFRYEDGSWLLDNVSYLGYGF